MTRAKFSRSCTLIVVPSSQTYLKFCAAGIRCDLGAVRGGSCENKAAAEASTLVKHISQRILPCASRMAITDFRKFPALLPHDQIAPQPNSLEARSIPKNAANGRGLGGVAGRVENLDAVARPISGVRKNVGRCQRNAPFRFDFDQEDR